MGWGLFFQLLALFTFGILGLGYPIQKLGDALMEANSNVVNNDRAVRKVRGAMRACGVDGPTTDDALALMEASGVSFLSRE